MDSDFVDDPNDEDYVEEIEAPVNQKKKKKRPREAASGLGGQTVASALNLVEDGNTDFRHLTLKKDHDRRPIWVTPEGVIILEAFSPLYKQAYEFLVAIAEPQARPAHIHRYKLTQNSLYSACAVAIETEDIIRTLGRLCKTDLPLVVEKFIKKCTATFGKAKLVLRNNQFFIESRYPQVLRALLKSDVIREAREEAEQQRGVAEGGVHGSLSEFLESDVLAELKRNTDVTRVGMNLGERADEGNSSDEESGEDTGVLSYATGPQRIQNVSFMISTERVQDVKRCALDLDYPLMEEYDYLNSPNPTLKIDLRPSTRIRKYQVKSLSKMFGNSRARSGIIVLPCGAGKSLTGITAAHTIKRSTIVLCYNNPSVKQWKEQFMLFTNIPEKSIRLFTSEHKELLPPPTEACVVISTYSMISYSGRRGDLTASMIEQVKSREWGLMLLDEVHVAPAQMFRRVLQVCSAHCKLGLTATLVREDGLIKDLNFLVGPKLYEANWMDLTQQGYLASVQCCEVWCPMTREFYDTYLSDEIPDRHKKMLYVLNPTKIKVCDYLVHKHKQRNDKIILFCDDIAALELYCEDVLHIPYICGDTPESDRILYITAFKTNPEVNVLGLSRVGDVALDIPEANVIIQVASHYGARRQEAQRLGRILRPKSNMSGHFNAFFYTLVSTDTREMFFSTKRQQYLVDQGYTFKVIQDLVKKSVSYSKLLPKKEDQLNLLNLIINKNADKRDKAEEKALSQMGPSSSAGAVDDEDEVPAAHRRTVATGGISGGAGLTYMEYDVGN